MRDEARRKTRTKVTAKRRKPRELVRGEAIVQRVLAATLGELARAGYKALRMEDVAVAAGVNKTTVYRRWPEKSGLVRDALSTLSADALAIPDTGSLRSDLIILGRRMANLFGACQGQSVFRMLVAEATDPEVVDLKKAMRERHEAIPKAVLAAAVERGELAADVDHTPLFEAFVGALHHKIFAMNERVPDTFVEQVVDLLLYGALQPSAKAKAGR